MGVSYPIMSVACVWPALNIAAADSVLVHCNRRWYLNTPFAFRMLSHSDQFKPGRQLQMELLCAPLINSAPNCAPVGMHT